jgi:pimeloyl-ACP methyl ester carboxylesterase
MIDSSRVLLVGIFAALLGGCASSPLKMPSSLPHYELRVATEDGWELALFRLEQRPGPASGQPIVLAPSVGMNRLAFMARGSNLAEHLSGLGFDVWIFEARGSQSSRPPDPAVWRRSQWTVDDIVSLDVPAAVETILNTTGRDALFWLGHGLGAQLGVEQAKAHPDQIAGIVGLGLAGDCSFPTRFQRRFSAGGGVVPPRGPIALRFLGRTLAPTLHLAPDTDGLHALFNEANVGVEVVSTLAAEALEDISAGITKQLQGWCAEGNASATQLVRSTFGPAAVPVLLMAGRVDSLAPPWAVQTAWNNWGGSDKELIILGEGWGQAYDYGHLDLILGDALRDEVFPLIEDWLLARTSVAADEDEVSLGEEAAAATESAP